MKESRFRGYKLITYLDDASGCVTTAMVFREATSDNAVAAIKRAIG